MITTKDLCMRFPDGSAIRYNDLCFENGQSYALLGASGCGKSTFLNLLAGVLTPDSGTVEIDGQNACTWSQRQKDDYRIRNIGYIFQDFKLLEGVDTSGIDGLLERLGILRLKKRRVRRLSGGEKQRVAIARALIKKPTLILADEPTGNLNYETGEAVVAQLIENAGSGTLIAVTHDDRLAPRFDHILDMNEIAHFEAGKEASERA